METSFIGHLVLANEPVLPILPITITSTTKRESRNYIAMIDTGATYSAISQKVASDLSFVSEGERIISTAGDEKQTANVATVKIRMMGTDGSILEDSIAATELNVNLNNCDVLIGLDVLQKAEFIYSGDKRSFSISFK